jgi:tetratricopeptide (TPR) repeat protein
MTSFAMVLVMALAGGAAAQLDRGQKLFQAGDLDGAMKEFDAAAKADPNDPRAPYLRGVVFEKKGAPQAAEKAYRDSLGRRSFPPAHSNLGALLLARGERGEAEKELQAAIKGDPKNADAHYNMGLLRDAEKKLPEAVAAYREAARVRPDDLAIRLNLGAALRRTGDLEGALAELRQATRLGPKDAIAWSNLGLLLSDKKSYDEARAALQKATQLDPKYVVAWYGLGRVEMRRKQAGAAADALEKARKLEPKDAGIAVDHCRALVDKDPLAARALSECRAALALEPDSAMARWMLSKSLVAQGQCAGARTEVDKFSALPTVKPEAKEQARTLLASCTAKKGK